MWHYGTEQAGSSSGSGSELRAEQVRSVAGVRELLQHVALMNDHCITNNLRAAGLGSLSVKEEHETYALLNANALVEETGYCLLTTAINYIPDYSKKCRVLSVLLLYGADVNVVDAHGRTPFMQCCVLGLDKVHTWLHARPLDLFLLDDDGNSCLHYAACYGRLRLLKVLLKMFRKQQMERYLDTADDPFDKCNHQGLTASQTALLRDQVECAAVIQRERERLHQRIRPAPARKISLRKVSRSTAADPLRAAGQRAAAIVSGGRRLTQRTQSFDTLLLMGDGHVTGDDDDEHTTGTGIGEYGVALDDLSRLQLQDSGSSSSNAPPTVTSRPHTIFTLPNKPGQRLLPALQPPAHLNGQPRSPTGVMGTAADSVRVRLRALLARRKATAGSTGRLTTSASINLPNPQNRYGTQQSQLDVLSLRRPSTGADHSQPTWPIGPGTLPPVRPSSRQHVHSSASFTEL